jgi:hypothetical protein
MQRPMLLGNLVQDSLCAASCLFMYVSSVKLKPFITQHCTMGRKNIMYRHFKCNEFEKYLDIRGRKSVDSSEHWIMRNSCDLYSTHCNITSQSLLLPGGDKKCM